MGAEMQLSDRIGRRLKLQDLHVLMAVVQAGSMSKAAVLLNTGQSAISRSIRELERTLGVCLLERGPRGVEPTPYGRAVLNGGASVFDDLRQTVKNIEFLADPATGEVRIGSNTFLAATFVSAVIKRLSHRYPRVVFHVVTGDDVNTMHRELSERDVDLLIARRLGLFAEEKFRFEILYDDSYVVVAGAQSPWARRRSIALAELVNEPWLLPPPERALGPVFLEAFRASGLDYPRTSVFTVLPEMRINLLTTGRFLTIVPMSVLRFSKRPEIKVLPVELQHARAPIGIVTLKNRTLGPVAQLFIHNAREVAKPLARRKW
jgi:DNA-binding transcriptional LysR family regulator